MANEEVVVDKLIAELAKRLAPQEEVYEIPNNFLKGIWSCIDCPSDSPNMAILGRWCLNGVEMSCRVEMSEELLLPPVQDARQMGAALRGKRKALDELLQKITERVSSIIANEVAHGVKDEIIAVMRKKVLRD